jgi:hypothetical protein
MRPYIDASAGGVGVVVGLAAGAAVVGLEEDLGGTAASNVDNGIGSQQEAHGGRRQGPRALAIRIQPPLKTLLLLQFLTCEPRCTSGSFRHPGHAGDSLLVLALLVLCICRCSL